MDHPKLRRRASLQVRDVAQMYDVNLERLQAESNSTQMLHDGMQATTQGVRQRLDAMTEADDDAEDEPEATAAGSQSAVAAGGAVSRHHTG